MRDLDRHRVVVEHDGADRHARAHGRLEVEAGHAERRIAHEVDAELVGIGDLGADRQAQPRAELVRFSPAHIAARPRRLVERQHLITRRAAVVGDDRILGIDQARELADDAIGRDRALARGELGRPLRHPSLGDTRNILRDRALHAGFGFQPIAYRLHEGRQHQFGVAQDADLGGVVLVEVAWIVRGVNDALGGSEDRCGDVVFGEAGADAEHDVAGVQVMATVAGVDDAARAQSQRMILGEGALAVGRGHHGRLQQVGQRHQFGRRFRIEHALTGKNHRRTGFDEQASGIVDVAWVGRGAHRADGRVVERRVADVGLHHVGGNFNHHGAEAAGFQRREGAPHHRHDVAGLHDGLDRFGHRRIGARRVEHREGVGDVTRMTQRQQQHGARVGKGAGDAGKRILRTGAVLHGEGGGRLAVGRACKAGRHVDADALLPADHRLEASRDGRLDDGGRGIAKKRVQPLAFQDLGNRIHHQHGALLRSLSVLNCPARSIGDARRRATVVRGGSAGPSLRSASGLDDHILIPVPRPQQRGSAAQSRGLSRLMSCATRRSTPSKIEAATW